MINYIIILSFLHSLLSQSSNDITCTLTQSSIQKPFPSLSKCYSHNALSCCTVTHDNYINQYISTLLTPSCMRKYDEFEYLMCFGCHPFESLYTDKINKKIKICKQFSNKLWKSDINEPSTVFDGCGFKAPSYLYNEASLNHRVIIPSQAFLNFTHFIDKIKIPFYEDYTIEIIEDEDTTDCFNAGNNNKLAIIYLFVFILALL